MKIMERRLEELQATLLELSARINKIDDRNLFEIKSNPRVYGSESFSGMNRGDTAWMIFATILVCTMTMPGVALFYGGLVPSSKSFLAAGLQTISITGLIAVLWLVIGYSISFGPNSLEDGHPLFGDTSRSWFRSMDLESYHINAPNIPESVYCFFNLSFAIITAALIPGSFTDKMKFRSLLVFIGMWHLLVYCPIAHANWHPNGFLYKLGVLDFAGGNVVHIASGISALIASMVIGRGFGKNEFPPHNVIITMIGGTLLWVGWYGFNAGSALGANSRAGYALLNTHICAGTSGLSFTICQYFDKSVTIKIISNKKPEKRKRIVSSNRASKYKRKDSSVKDVLRGVLEEEAHLHDHAGFFPKIEVTATRPDMSPTLLSMICGVVAGLVAITPAAGFIHMTGAFVLGVTAGPACYFGCTIKKLLGIEDSLDAFGIHAIAGVIGGIGAGLFAQEDIGGVNGAFYGNPKQLLIQLYGILFSFGWAGIMTFLILLLLSKTIGIRATLNFNNVGGRRGSTNTGSASPNKRQSRGGFSFLDFSGRLSRGQSLDGSAHGEAYDEAYYGYVDQRRDSQSRSSFSLQFRKGLMGSPIVLSGKGSVSPNRRSIKSVAVYPSMDPLYENEQKLPAINEHMDNSVEEIPSSQQTANPVSRDTDDDDSKRMKRELKAVHSLKQMSIQKEDDEDV